MSIHPIPTGPTRKKQWLKALITFEPSAQSNNVVRVQRLVLGGYSPGISAFVSFTDTGSEAVLVDDLLFASISSWATLTEQNFRTRQAFNTLLSPRGLQRAVLFFYIRYPQ